MLTNHGLISKHDGVKRQRIESSNFDGFTVSWRAEHSGGTTNWSPKMVDGTPGEAQPIAGQNQAFQQQDFPTEKPTQCFEAMALFHCSVFMTWQFASLPSGSP